MVVEDCLVVRDIPQPHWHWVQNCSAGETLLSQAGGIPGLLPCFCLPPLVPALVQSAPQWSAASPVIIIGI